MPAAKRPTRLSTGITKFTNCRILRHGRLEYGDLWISSRSGKILDSQAIFYEQQAAPDNVVDLEGKIVAPGFIEVQINGAFGFDFSVIPDDISLYAKGLKRVSQSLMQTGVTSYLPTMTSQRSEVYHKALPFLAPSGLHRRPEDGAEILGAHCEGPFISPHKNGVHSRAVLQTAKNGFSDIETSYGAENMQQSIKMITVAPELPGILESIPRLRSCGITVSIGHSESTYDEALAALGQGATMITHLFNAMSPLHHRDPGIFGVLASPGITAPYFGIIADGIHLHPSSIKIAWNTCPSGLILVTDAMRTLGMPDGRYDWTNGETFTKTGPVLVLDGTDGKLAGTSISLIECLNHFVTWTNATIAQALATVTETPARMLGIERTKGFLHAGADADLVVLDELQDGSSSCQLHIEQVWKFGACVFDRDS